MYGMEDPEVPIKENNQDFDMVTRNLMEDDEAELMEETQPQPNKHSPPERMKQVTRQPVAVSTGVPKTNKSPN